MNWHGLPRVRLCSSLAVVSPDNPRKESEMTGTKLYVTVGLIALAVDIVGQGVVALVRRKLPARVQRAIAYPAGEDRPGTPSADIAGEMG